MYLQLDACAVNCNCAFFHRLALWCCVHVHGEDFWSACLSLISCKFLVGAVHTLAPRWLWAWGQINPLATSNYKTETFWWALRLYHYILVPLGGHTALSVAARTDRDYTHYQVGYHYHLFYAWQHILRQKWLYSQSIKTVWSNKTFLIHDLRLHHPPMPWTTTWIKNGTESITNWEWANTNLHVDTRHDTHGGTRHPSHNT